MLNLGVLTKPAKTLDAVGLLLSYGVRLAPDREEVAVAAARDGQSHADPSVGRPDMGLGRIEAQGQGMLAKLNHDLDQKLREVDAEIIGCKQELDTQAKAAEDEKRQVAEKVEARQRVLTTLEACATAKGRPLHKLGLRKLSTRTYLILLAVFGVADAILNATALLVIGEGSLAVWGLALTLMVAMLWVSHVAGTELRAAEERLGDARKDRRHWWAIACLVTIFVFLVAIGSIRADYLEMQGVPGQLLAVYALQLIVAVAAVAAAYYHADPDAAALQQANDAVEQARNHERAEEEELSRLWVTLKEKQVEKVYEVLGYLRAGEAALKLIDELKFLYATVYVQALRAAAQPTVDVPVSPTQPPEWMWAWAIWLDQQTDVDRASVGAALPRELPPPVA